MDGRATYLFLPLVLSLTACGGGGSSSGGNSEQQNTEEEPSSTPAPKAVRTSIEESGITVDWQPVEDANSYNIYYATEKGLDADNYAAYENGTWIQNIQPPHTVQITELRPIYHFVITANANGKQGKQSDEAIAVPRYLASQENPSRVIDRVHNLEWERCTYGQTFNELNDSCDGAAQRLNFSEARQAASSIGMDVPTKEQLLSIVFCSSGSAEYFPYESPTGSCTFNDTSPTTHAVAFPHAQTETSSYITASYCTVDTLELVTLESGTSSICAGPPDSLSVNLLPVKQL